MSARCGTALAAAKVKLVPRVLGEVSDVSKSDATQSESHVDFMRLRIENERPVGVLTLVLQDRISHQQ